MKATQQLKDEHEGIKIMLSIMEKISNDLEIADGLALVNTAFEQHPENGAYMYTYGMALYKSGKLEESLKILKRSWDLASYYDHEHYLLIKRIEQALARQNQ